ncbi:MAG: EF-hand domain-containing protein [Hormoscilla sp. GUM202]|nr:EF-hand domain-containing protein [Hormoscilla sp. GUM202]
MLTELQIRKWKRLFHVYDANENGVVEKADFEEIFQNIVASRNLIPGTPKYDRLYAEFMSDWELLRKDADKNNNGKIELTEWLKHGDRRINSPEMCKINIDMANDIFELLDINGDGVISLEEYKTIFWIWRLPEELATKNFPLLDINCDGRISKEEFKILVEQFYQSDDPDAPGNLFFGPY